MAEKTEPSVRKATVNDKEWSVPEEALDDFEMLDDIARYVEGDTTRAPSMMRRLLGDDQAREAMASLRDPETGRASTEAGFNFVSDLLKALNPN